MVMKAGEEAGRHNLKKPAPVIDPMSTRAQGSGI
jgi:hypothetical protein